MDDTGEVSSKSKTQKLAPELTQLISAIPVFTQQMTDLQKASAEWKEERRRFKREKANDFDAIHQVVSLARAFGPQSTFAQSTFGPQSAFGPQSTFGPQATFGPQSTFGPSTFGPPTFPAAIPALSYVRHQ